MSKCVGCKEDLKVGEPVFQLAKGKYMRTYITPTFDPWLGVLAEWHHDCFPIDVSPQEQPYHCVVCGEEVEDGEEVFYITRGRKPRPPYQRLEGRGYKLPLIAHMKCWPEG